MAKFNFGDKVRIKDRKDWPTPPGYILAHAEGTVVRWVEYDGVANDFQDYVHVNIERTGPAAKVYVGSIMPFQVDKLENINKK